MGENTLDHYCFAKSNVCMKLITNPLIKSSNYDLIFTLQLVKPCHMRGNHHERKQHIGTHMVYK